MEATSTPLGQMPLHPIWALSPLVSLPFLLLGLYLALLVLAVGLCSWVGHSARPAEEARRVADAAERAGLGHLVAPLRLAVACVLVFTVLIGALSIIAGLPTKWFLLGPLVAPVLVATTLLYCARRALRTAGQLAGIAGADAKLILTGRSVLGLVLCCEAALGLVILGTYSLSTTELTFEQARFLSYVVGASIALFAVVFARATTSAEITSYGGTSDAPDGPHPGSLALLVSATFHAPLLKLVALVVLSTLGHCALLSIEGLSGQEEKLWLFPHLLKLLGLFGLLFAGLVVRTSEEEHGGEGWVRGAIVYLVLMVAGAWSLSSQLPADWARSVPAGLSFFYIAFGLSLWLSTGASREAIGISPRAEVDLNGALSVPRPGSGGSLGSQAYLNVPSVLLFLILLCILILGASLTPESGAAEDASAAIQLPAGALSSLLLSAALSALPIVFTWLLATALSKGSRQAELLAYVGEKRSSSLRTPSSRLLLALPMLASVIVLTSLTAAWNEAEMMDELTFTLFGVGAVFGGLTLAGLLGHVERACLKASREIAQLLRLQKQESERHPPGQSAPINFEDAVVYCRQTTGASAFTWLLLCLTPCWVAGAALFFVPPLHFQTLTLGLGTGATLLAVGMLLLQGTESENDKRALSHLAFVSAIAQGLWLLAAGNFPA